MFTELGPPEAAALRASLYEREVRMRYKAGDALLYRLDLLHRGSPVLPGMVRHTHHLNYRRAECDWIGHNTWAKDLWLLEASEGDGFSREGFLAGLSDQQLAAIGGPSEARGRM